MKKEFDSDDLDLNESDDNYENYYTKPLSPDRKFGRVASILERFTDQRTGEVDYDALWARYDLDELSALGVVPLSTNRGKTYVKKNDK